MPDAVVVGGGVVGASTAYHLAAAGADVLLFDRGNPGRATAAGAGIVSPASSRHADPDWYDLALPAARYYPELVAALEPHADPGYVRGGTLVVAADADELDDYAAARERAVARQAERGHPPAEELYELDPAEAREQFPPMGDVEAAFYYAGGARVDGRALTEALVRAGEAAGLDARTADVTRLRIDGDRVTGVETAAGDRFDAPAVIVAGGAWSGEFAGQLGHDVPVEPQRGQIVHLDVPDGSTSDRGDAVDGSPGDWPVVSAFHGHYLVPWADGRIVAGATRETGSGYDPRATAGGVREVLAEALRVAPWLADAELREVRVGLRPASADGLPVVGAVPGVDGAYLATGHGPTGLTLGPYTGKLTSQLVRGEAVENDLSAFAPGRF